MLDYVDAERAIAEWRSAGLAITEMYRLLTKHPHAEIHTETIKTHNWYNRISSHWLDKGLLSAPRYLTNPGSAWREWANIRDTIVSLAERWKRETGSKVPLPQALRRPRDPLSVSVGWGAGVLLLVLAGAVLGYMLYTGKLKLGK